MIILNLRKPFVPSFLYLAAVALFCAVLPGISVAQDNSTPIEEIVVTGSHIARDPTNYVGPMSIVTGADIARQPTYSLQDMLLKVPSIGMQGTSRNNANGGRGAQFTGIHQLTPQRTLVLMNGRRMVSRSWRTRSRTR